MATAALPTPTEIAYFLELYANRHLSNSAIRLGVAQPSLTQSLQRLEGKVGAKLFVRTKRGLVPSSAGKHFYARAKTLLEDWQGLRGGIASLGQELKGRFRIGCHAAVGAYALPPLLRKLNAAAPGIEIDLAHDFSRKLAERLIACEIDLAYVVNPVRHPDLVLLKVGEDRVTFWKKRGAKAPPRRILRDPDGNAFERLRDRNRVKAFDGWTMLHSSSLELVRTLALDGQGVAVLPERVAVADSGALAPYDPGIVPLRDEIYLAYRKDMLSGKASRALVDFAKAPLE